MSQKSTTKTSNLKKTGTLLISAILISSCSTFFACRAAQKVAIYAFDNSKGVLYHGKKDQPDDSIPYGDKRLDQYLALSLSDWEYVRVKCKVDH